MSDLEAMREIVRQEAIRGDRWEVIVEQFEAAADEVDRLRAVIENAPHDWRFCPVGDPEPSAIDGDPTICLCWKAEL